MPFAMCASTGFVPQWYMNTPGSSALNRNVNESPGATSLKATFGAMRAAWKSIECGIAPPFVKRHLDRLALRVRGRPGPGAPWPSNAHVLYLTPGAISTVMSLRVMWTFARSPAGTAGSAASVAAWRHRQLLGVVGHRAGKALQREADVALGRVRGMAGRRSHRVRIVTGIVSRNEQPNRDEREHCHGDSEEDGYNHDERARLLLRGFAWCAAWETS